MVIEELLILNILLLLIMNENKNIVITIGRQYGSGGRDIGELLAKELNIPFYNKDLLTMAAKNSGLCEEIVEMYDEKPTSSLLYCIVSGAYNNSQSLPINHKLFLAQFETIRKIAAEGSCVIIGRCADYALEDMPNCLNIFIHSDMDKRIERAINNYGIDKNKAKSILTKKDKQRATYYNFYSSKKWGDGANYHLIVDSGKLGIENTVKVIKNFVDVYKSSVIPKD